MSDQQDEKACRKRIESAEVADAAFAVSSTDKLHDVVRRYARGLVDKQQTFRTRGHVSRAVSRLILRRPGLAKTYRPMAQPAIQP